MKRLLVFSLALLLILLSFVSCKNDKAEFKIEVINPFFKDNLTISATVINTISINPREYITSNMEYFIVDNNDFIYTGLVELDEGENRFRITTNNDDKYDLIINCIFVDELFVEIVDDYIYSIGEPFDFSHVKIYGTSENDIIDIPNSFVNVEYNFNESGETDVWFNIDDLYAYISVKVEGEYVPTLDNKMSLNDGTVYMVEGSFAKVLDGKNTSGIVSIPKQIKYNGNIYIVDEILEYAFSENENITMVNCEYISKINMGAFFNCKNLQSVFLKEKECIILDNAFSYCTSLKKINLPFDIDKISNGLFTECKFLYNISIPSTVKYIGDNAFLRCEKLEYVNIPEGIEYIGNGAFKNCQNLEGVLILDATLSYIGDEAFFGCEHIESIVCPGTFKYFGENVFDENIHIYTTKGTHTALYCLKNDLSYDKWDNDTIHVINFKETYNIGDKISFDDMALIVFSSEKIARLSNYDLDYDFDISGKRYVTASYGDFNVKYSVFIEYIETLTVDTDSRGCKYELDKINGTAKLIFVPEKLQDSNEYNFDNNTLIIPTSVIFAGEEYNVIEIEKDAICNNKNIERIYIHNKIIKISDHAIGNLENLKLLYIPHELGEVIIIEDNNLFDLNKENVIAYVSTKNSIPYVFIRQRGFNYQDILIKG